MTIDRARLVGWYLEGSRDLPWRADPTPYRVLLSEFMCQQTRVATALPYFERFLERWPTLADLAEASEQEVLEAWAGLGYYSRARRLHQVSVAANRLGGLPSTQEALLALPGIGPYTAGAIASIAFGERVPAPDGNVERVLSRFHAHPDRVDDTAGKAWVRDTAAALHRGFEGHPGNLNQALMELGATVCTPRRPRCSSCPIATGCLGSADPLLYPKKRARTPPVPITGVAAVIHTPDGVWMTRRPGEGLLGGLWTPPVVLGVPADDVQALATHLQEQGATLRSAMRLGDVRHVFSHRDLRCTVYEVDATIQPGQGRIGNAGGGLSALAKKILAVPRPGPLLLAADSAGDP